LFARLVRRKKQKNRQIISNLSATVSIGLHSQ